MSLCLGSNSPDDVESLLEDGKDGVDGDEARCAGDEDGSWRIDDRHDRG